MVNAMFGWKLCCPATTDNLLTAYYRQTKFLPLLAIYFDYFKSEYYASYLQQRE